MKADARMSKLIWIARAAASTALLVISSSPEVSAQEGARQSPQVYRVAQDTRAHAYCWATRAIDDGQKRTYYFSRVWAMESDGPTIGFHPEFNSYVDARYSSIGGVSAQCLRFFGRSEAERQMNNLAANARRNGNQVVFTNWRWWD